MATLEKVYNKSMATVTSQKKDLAQFCRYLTSDEPGSTFVQQLKQKNHKLYQRLAVTFVNEHRAELIQKVTTVRSIADALYSKKMVDNELNSQIQAETTSQDKMRLLYKALDSAEAVKAAFFKLLAQEQFPLVQDLAKKKLRQLEACDVDVP
ncbi:apoptosis-associated speck-like protein containing a CARD [Anguilla anguilla]|uniref:apoptosis-associated speck-like protein containing a CARD n=1 Tax=Anguilla anguilla TaxID=7936 RepID=UPI0015B1FC62|nr:apoptosis-associated speck-like protein containing a CARD [Anguilla anguilla]